MRRREVPSRMYAAGGRVFIEETIADALLLAEIVPVGDGWTQDLRATIAEAEAQAAEIAER